MLSELYIKNLAVIEEARIPFTDDLNVFTGETGAGKSILINGINSVLGQRVTRDIVRTGCDKAVVTALFTGLSPAVRERLDAAGIEHEDDELVLTREVRADGKSTARINGAPASAAVMRDIGSTLVNIHGQHDNQLLLDPSHHIEMLDSFGGLEGMLAEYRQCFTQLQDISRRLKRLAVEQRENTHLRYELEQTVKEIGDADLDVNEEEELNNEYRISLNSEQILGVLSKCLAVLKGDEDENGAVDGIKLCTRELSALEDSPSKCRELAARLDSAAAELDDIAAELSAAADSVDIDGERLAYILDRITLINELKRKYGPDVMDVLGVYEGAKARLDSISDSEGELSALSEERTELLHKTSALARELSEKRSSAGERLAAAIESELDFLNMPDVKMSVNITHGNLTAQGMDTVEFLISTNKGEEMRPVSKIASGGELSRIMLAFRSALAEKNEIPTLIFDEIDAGVSGRAAQKIGTKLKQVSRQAQVICVTHLSQLAVYADNHLLIEKNTADGRTYTSVAPLDKEGRIREIARIMVGSSITDTALQNARELLESAREG
jgi:DNA repair protein RecN (Recombination protein N)